VDIHFSLFPESHSLKEPPHRPPVELRQPGDDHCTYAIAANFILSHLLICDADELGRAVLSNVGGEPGGAEAPAYLAVNEIGFVPHLITQKSKAGLSQPRYSSTKRRA
jgi:hypothetical protein